MLAVVSLHKIAAALWPQSDVKELSA
jgi:hypothetical protein